MKSTITCKKSSEVDGLNSKSEGSSISSQPVHFYNCPMTPQQQSPCLVKLNREGTLCIWISVIQVVETHYKMGGHMPP